MAAADVIQPIVTELTKSLLESFRQDLDYLIRPNRFVRKMNLLVQSLVDDRNIVQKAVDDALNFGKQIKPEVLRWLKSAGDIIAQAELLLKDSSKRCFHGWCVDLGTRYNINKGAVEISERITKVLPPPGSTSVALAPPPPTVLSDPEFMEFESTIETMQQIIEALKDAECGVVGIFGMGGIGKTTIVKKCAEMVKRDRRFNQVVMAVVSQSPDLKKIQGEIASMLDLDLNQEAGVEGRASQLHKHIMNLKNILVILDDVWAWLDLTTIGIPGFVEHSGCKVLLTTRNEDVCTSMSRGNEKKIKVGVLSEEESWELFKRSAGNSIETWPELKEVALNVMKECQGLPIALKIVGSALRGKDIGQWESAKLQLSMSITTNIEGMNKKVISCLRLSYDYLESDEMKTCFLICCLFPEDFNIPCEIVVRYAIGKGLFWYADRIEKARNLTKTTLQKLKASCLLLESGHSVMGEECFKVHDVVRDVGLVIASEAKLLSRSGPGLGRWLQNNSMKHVKGASFITEEFVSLPGGIHCTELEHLCLFAKNVDYSDAFFETMKELKVLIYHGLSRLPTSLTCSVSLRTLHLDECEVGDISAIGELKKLEILTINNTDIESLPVEVGKLTSLRLLDLRKNRHLKSIPGNVISQLCRLEELYIGASFDGWEIEGTSGDAEKGRSASLLELQSLPRLAILNVCVRHFTSIPLLVILFVSNFTEIPRNLSLPKLVKFDVEVGNYQRSHVERYQISRALNLGKAEFRNDEGLKSLSEPDEAAVDNGKYILTDLPGGGGLNGLDSLKIVGISWIASLTTANTNKVVFANLQKLILHGVGSLKGLASGMGTSGGVLPTGSLRQLKFLEIKWCRGLDGWVVPSSWTHRLHDIETVTIEESDCCGLFEVKEQILAAAGEPMTTTMENNSTRLLLLSNLREIRLNHMPRLYALTNGESSSVDFSNLRIVDIERCLKLDSIFTPNVSQSLVHLETLRISKCLGLKMIFEEGDTNSSSEETTSRTTFPNLKTVAVKECKQLKSLLTVSMAKGLLKLEELYVDGNLKLEEIICSNKNRAGATEEKEINDAESSITWPQIRRIKIQNSSYLKRFCPRNSCIEMPLLQEFKHIKCSDGMENFGADPPAYGLKIPQSATNVTEENSEEEDESLMRLIREFVDGA